MSYRVDIPTLSANEVYTLTFEYEGTETIQLIVGDLTLETTDRRVVFTTTSPVNYIESNVNLTNLNMYEGYYESDDQGGEYTQESYIEGKTEITDNVVKCVKSPKIVSRNEDGTEESIVSTPDDLELYCTYNEYGDIYKQDVLDLQSGTITRNIIKYRLNDYLNSTNKQLTTQEWTSASGNEYVILTLQHFSSSTGAFGRPISNCINGISATGLCFTKSQTYYSWSYYRADIEQIVTDANMMRFIILKSRFSDIDYTDSTMATQWVKDQDFTLLIPVATTYTEQLPTSINPLKSYRNGSIQTSSQQLTPTLKTTLPISNKFTTTNLTSGSTYNVYFDGTATKLDTGGTIITNPISPCEVECGGTTLTIEGTDIQNVRVIETTVKNEVGNNGTSDVELSKIEASDVNGENIITSTLEQPIKLRSLGTTYDSYNPVTGELTKRIGVSETDGSYSVLSSPIVDKPKTIRTLTNTQPTTTYTKNTDGVTFWCDVTSTITPVVDSKYFIKVFNKPQNIVRVNFATYNANIVNDCAIISAKSTSNRLHFYDDTKTTTLEDLVNTTFIILEYQDGMENWDIPYFEGTQDVTTNVTLNYTPQLYTNGQVKVFSDSEVYPTTILNGQSTNNYEINELNTSDNYTIRYEGECESINLANKSNTQGHNVLVKAGATSGNLTFVNDNGYINNVLLVQNDVREQEINHFKGMETVEVKSIINCDSGIVDTLFAANYLGKDNVILGNNGNITQDGHIYLLHHSTRGEIFFNSITLNTDEAILVRVTQLTYGSASYYIRFGLDSYASDIQNSEKVKSVIDEKGYCDVIMNNNSNKTLQGNLKLTNYYDNWKISHVAIVKKGTTEYNANIIDLPQPVQLNSLPDGTCDTYNPITGEYVQNVGYDDITNYDTYYKLTTPIITQLDPITIPTFEGGIVQLITTNDKVFPMIEYSMPTNNRYDTSSWETGVVYTQRNMTEVYFNESTTPMTPTETMTLTTDHISSGSIILNDNGNGLIVLKGNYTGRDIPYFTGMRSVEAIEVETTPSPDQPLFGKGGRK